MDFNYCHLSVLQQAILDYLAGSISGKSKTVKQVFDFITNNALVSETATITRRTIQRNLTSLEDKGLLKKERIGRTDYYTRVFSEISRIQTKTLFVKSCQNDEALSANEIAKRFPSFETSGCLEYQSWVLSIVDLAKSAISSNRQLMFAIDVDSNSRSTNFIDIPISKGYRLNDVAIIGVRVFAHGPHLLYRQSGQIKAVSFDRLTHVEVSDKTHNYINRNEQDLAELAEYSDCLKPVNNWVRYNVTVSDKVIDLIKYRQLKGIRSWSYSEEPNGIQLSFEYDEFNLESALLVELITPFNNSSKIRSGNRF